MTPNNHSRHLMNETVISGESCPKRRIVLLVGVYVASSKERTSELIETLERNTANPEIDEIHAFIEDADFSEKLLGCPAEIKTRFGSIVANSKVVRIDSGKRTLFSDHFKYANEKFAAHVAVVANSDIWFDGTIGLLRRADLDNTFICLAKYEGDPPKLWGEPHMSQDVWAFVPPIPTLMDSDFTMGRPACDNVIAASAREAGMKVINPCHSIVAHHLDDRRRDRSSGYMSAVGGPMMSVPASALSYTLT